MVRVVDATVPVEQRLGVRREDGVRAEGPDLADQLLAQGQVVGERAVGLVQEGHAGIADDRGRGALFGLSRRAASSSGSASGSSPPWSPLVQHTSQPSRAGIDPGRGGPGRPEVGIVRVGRDDHESGRPPIVRDGGGGFSAHPSGASCSRPDRALRFAPGLRSSPPTSEVSFHLSGRRPAGPHQACGTPSRHRAPPGPRRRVPPDGPSARRRRCDRPDPPGTSSGRSPQYVFP